MINLGGYVERYRPTSFNEVIGQPKIIESLRQIVKRKKENGEPIPHMLFIGPPGTGKTTLALCFARELYGLNYKQYFYEYNASDARKIDDVREKIKPLTQVVTINGIPNIIFYDEADGLCLPEGTTIITGNKPSYFVKKIENIGRRGEKIINRWISIPSVNLETGEIENDKGKLVDSGFVNFYKLVLEDGREVVASSNHPFFVLVSGKLTHKKLKDLNIGEEIVDYSDKFACKTCGKMTLKTFCCRNCKDKAHSILVKGEGNPRYKAIVSDETKQKMSISVREAYQKGILNQKTPEIRLRNSKRILKILNDPVKIVSKKYVGRGKAWNITMKKNPCFILANGILTHNTFDSQQALRRIMEKSHSAVFILSVNTEQKLTEAIRSRCVPFHFQALDKQDIGIMLKRVLDGEKIQLKKTPEESQALHQIINDSRGDLRKALNILEKIVTSDKALNVQSVLELKPIDQISEAIKTALSGDFVKAKNLMEDVYQKNGDDVDKIIDAIYDSLDEVEQEEIRNRLYFEMGDLEHKIQYSHRPLYQLISFIAFVWVAPHLQR